MDESNCGWWQWLVSWKGKWERATVRRSRLALRYLCAAVLRAVRM